MNPQVILGKDGNIAIATPLFIAEQTNRLAYLNGYSVMLMSTRPVAYAVDFGGKTCPFLNAKIVEQRCEFLGDL